MKILITGGTGFVGNRLIPSLLNNGHELVILTRNKNRRMEKVRFVENLDEIKKESDIDVIINLAGAPISKRWSSSYKKELINSRVGTTNALVDFIKNSNNKPKLMISASAIGYYGSSDNTKFTEKSSSNEEFTSKLCKEWESSAKQVEDLGVNLCIARLGVVLGKNGGALKQMLPAFKLGLGGKIGSGEQYFSWVDIEDVVSAFNFFIGNNCKGIFNLTAPNPVTNIEFTKSLANRLKRPAILPMPAFIVKLLFGEMGESLLLNGQRVIPKNLLESKFKFRYDNIDASLASIIKD